jgi:hypothetical protein
LEALAIDSNDVSALSFNRVRSLQGQERSSHDFANRPSRDRKIGQA